MDKNKTMAAPTTNLKPKRPITNNTATTSQRQQQNERKTKTKINKNNTIVGCGESTICNNENSSPNFDAEYREIAYGRFLRALLEDSVVEAKISQEETIMDMQMAQLADRFMNTMKQLDKTNKRLKDIRFVVEHKRLLDLKNKDCTSFYNLTEKSQMEDLLKKLSTAEQAKLDLLETKNIDFGYNKESGYKQLLDAADDAIEGLESIKKHSDIGLEKLRQYEKTQKSLEELFKKERIELENLKTEFTNKFPEFNEKLLMQVSENMSNMINNYDEDDLPI